VPRSSVFLLLVPAAAGSTPAVRVAVTQANGNGTVVATYDADGTGGAAVTLGDSPSWSPDGTQLAVAYRAQTNDPADIAVGRRLTSDAGTQASNTSPEWSPRGDQIAFFKSTAGIPQVWLVSPAGTGARALTNDPAQKFSLQWSPDGSRLLWDSAGPYGMKGRDKICGRPGADHNYGREGDDYIDAGSGDDVIYPGPATTRSSAKAATTSSTRATAGATTSTAARSTTSRSSTRSTTSTVARSW